MRSTPKFILSVLLFLPVSALATSGACSYHNGANCLASDTDGSAVCNDGWKNSSVPFYLMSECNTAYIPPYPCHRPSETGCASEYTYKLMSLNCFDRVGQPGCSQSDWDTCQKEHSDYPVLLNEYYACDQKYYQDIFATPIPIHQPTVTPVPSLTPSDGDTILQKITDCSNLIRGGTYNFSKDSCVCPIGTELHKVTNDVYDFACFPAPIPTLFPIPAFTPLATKIPKIVPTPSPKVDTPSPTVSVSPTPSVEVVSVNISSNPHIQVKRSFLGRLFSKIRNWFK